MNDRYDAIVFDCDGTLVDTMPTHYRAWQAELAGHGIPFPEDRFYALGGVPAERVVAMLAEEAGVELDAAAVAEAKEQRFVELAGEVRAVERVVAIAAANRGALPMAVATGSPAWLAQRMLLQLGIAEWFDALVSCEQVSRPKPDPETFLLAAERLEVAPERCLAYEDSETGIAAAEAAGMEVIDARTLYDR